MRSNFPLVTFSKGLAKRRLLPTILGHPVAPYGRKVQPEEIAGIVGWGLKDNTGKARQYAKDHNLSYLTVEDGFIRSIGLGVQKAEPFGFIIDKKAIYYDARRPSDLEILIHVADNVDSGRARKLMARIVRHQIYKYNHVWDSVPLSATKRPRILLIDQTFGDLSVKYGMANADSFRQMLAAARERYPDGAFFVKTHPDVIAGKKKGYLAANLPADITLIGTDCNPFALIDQVDHVYTVTSQMGFEALMAGKPVSCFGLPFYAGWGVTEDRINCPRRNVHRSIEEIFHAAYLKYVRYVDPLTGHPADLERIVDRIVAHKQVDMQNTGNIYCFGFRYWKRGIIRRFLDSPRARVCFVNRAAAAEKAGLDEDSRIVVWGLRNDADVLKLARCHGIRVERVEDGFIRSVGLGSDFARPSSLIVDNRGIYFDPRSRSELEDMLNTVAINDHDRKMACQLRKTIVSMGISKYNTGRTGHLELDAEPGQTIILVPGQVEDDASIAAGCVDIRTNEGLLAEVRSRFPDAYILYKPHPDVLAGNRAGKISLERAKTHCDRIVTDRNISICLDAVDEVHTLTSLAGFEALMRGKKVFTYGRPFYAGWGLTEDRHPIDRRRRCLSLDDLVYCCLISYPRYYDWQARCFVHASDIVEHMRQQIGKRDVTIKPNWLLHIHRKARYLLQDFREILTDIFA